MAAYFKTLHSRLTSSLPAHWNRFPAALKFSRVKALIVAILILIAVVSTKSPVFLSTRNFVNILEQLSVNAIIAAGMTFVIIAAGIDLSVGSILALGSMGTAALLVSGIPVPAAILGGLLVGTGVGALNGVAIAYGRIPAFIMTLGMLNVARGAVLFLTRGNSIVGFPEEFVFLGRGRIGPVPVLVLVTAAVYLICHFVLVKTRFGRYTLAIGDNPETARRVGIRVRRHQLWLYALSGLFASLAGILLAARLDSALTQAGTGAELDVIAAVVIGGTSLYGGRGSIPGTLLGVIFFQIVRNSLNLLGISVFLQQVAVGALLIFSALADFLSARWAAHNK